MKTVNWTTRRNGAYLIAATAASAAAQALCLAFGYEAETRLPRAGIALLLPMLVLLCAAAGALYLTHGLEKSTQTPLQTLFVFEGTAGMTAGVAGSFLLLFGAALGFVWGEGRTNVVFAALTGLCTLYLVATLRRGQLEPMMTLPPAYLTPVLLLLHYRERSSDPVWAHFYVEVLALAALTGAYLMLSAFAFRQGKPRSYAAVALLSVPLCVCAAMQATSLAAALRLLGHAAVQVSLLTAFRPERAEPNKTE